MNPDHALRDVTRRHFFSRCTMGVGSIALASLMAERGLAAAPSPKMRNPLAPKKTHFPAKAKNVIFLFMAGGPSQLDLFEHKPQLTALNGQPIPESYTKGKRFAFMDSSHRTNLLASKFAFHQHGKSGAWVSDLLPHTAGIVDEISILTTCKTDLFNHAPAKLFMNAGSGLFGRPSMGAWVTYGLGSECDDLPGFVVLQSGPRGPRGGAVLWGSDAIGGTVHARTAPADASDGWHGEWGVRYATAEEAFFNRLEFEGGKPGSFALRGGVTDKNFGTMRAGSGSGELPGTEYDERDYDLRFDVPLDDGVDLTILAHG
ncbi:MAG: DUF1501 domain-containing protein, partial [Chthoniobacteraceae bacterium]